MKMHAECPLLDTKCRLDYLTDHDGSKSGIADNNVEWQVPRTPALLG